MCIFFPFALRNVALVCGLKVSSLIKKGISSTRGVILVLKLVKSFVLISRGFLPQVRQKAQRLPSV